MQNIYAVKGNIIFTKEFGKYETYKNGYIVVEGKFVKGVYNELPAQYSDIVVKDYGDSLIIPGFVDLHFHSSKT